MNIILDEKEWADKAVSEPSLGDNVGKTLQLVAQYYYEEGYSKAEVRRKLDEYILLCTRDTKLLTGLSGVMDSVTKSAGKRPLITIDGVRVTDVELRHISSLVHTRIQRLAFTLLCLAKYFNAVNPKNSNWVNVPNKDIIRMANVGTSQKLLDKLLYDMRNQGLVAFSRKVDSLSIQVNFVHSTGKEKLFVTDFRNLGNQYLMYLGEKYFQCKHCGLTIKRRSNRQKYCPDCATAKYMKEVVEPTIYVPKM